MAPPRQTALPGSAPAARGALRQQLLARRNTLEPSVQANWDQEIGRRLLDWCAAHPANLLGGYWPMRGEPDLRPAYTALAARGVQLALPVVIERAAPLRFALWAPGTPLTAGAFGTLIPADLSWVEPPVLLVPCLGFSTTRIRLGYGGGYYDRTLAAALRPLLALGIAYDCLHAEFEGAPHDIALNGILTESGCR